MKNKHNWYTLGMWMSFIGAGFCIYYAVTNETWALIMAISFISLAFVLYKILY
jgi:hypothetical protein